MISRYQEFTRGYFDVVITDECHRSIYGAWQTALTHFDALHIGLTATPAAYIGRNTYRFYQCKDFQPDFSYSIQDALSELGGMTEDDLRRRYKVILSNPPFAGVLPKQSIRKDLPKNTKKSEILFLGVMMEALAPGGCSAVVVPEWLLFGSTKAHVELRRGLVEEYELLAVIFLPAGIFKPYAGVKTCVIVFRKPPMESLFDRLKTGKVWFYEVSNDGYDPDKITGGVRPETPELNDIPGLLKQEI